MHTNSRFAVAIHILTLMAYKREQALTSEYIARSVTTNPVVIRRTLGDLRRAGLVASHPGAGGGWRLLRSPERITLLDAYHAVGEGLPFALPPHPPNPQCRVGRAIQQAVTGYFEEAEAAMQRRFADITIAQALAEVETPRHTSSCMQADPAASA